ncbi:MAG: phosphatidate cytidylyltransferase [Desulfatibacillaceae bacterium]
MELTEHKKRWLTAAVAVPLLLYLFFIASEMPFTLLIIAVGLVGQWEYHRMVGLSEKMTDPGFLWAELLGTAIIAAAHMGSIATIFFLLWAALFIFAFRAMYLHTRERASFEILAADLLGVLYLPCLLASLVLLRAGDAGRYWILMAAAIAFVADTSAYYAGRFFGKHKLSPKLSPGKTIEGAVGGMCGGILVALIGKAFFITGLPVGAAVGMGALGAVFGMLGDLFESMIKRTFGIKDSGSILPGHGGILDRIDGLLFAAPVVFCFKYFYA